MVTEDKTLEQLKDEYQEFLQNNLSKEDCMKIALKVGRSLKTIEIYVSGNGTNLMTARVIYDYALTLLKDKNITKEVA